MVLRCLDLKLGFACNNNCLSCPAAHRRHLGDLSTLEVKEKLLEGRKKGDEQVILTGGEPTIRADLLEVIEYAKSIGYKDVKLQSNGRMLAYKGFCRKVIAAGATSFMLGIHGPNPKVHDYLVQSPGAFKQAINGVKNLKAEGMPVAINSVISKISYKHAPETAELFVDLDVDLLQFSFIHCVGNALKNIDLLLPRKSEVMPFIHRSLDIGLKAGIKTMVEAYPFCFLKGYEACSSEIRVYYRESRDAEGVRENFSELRKKAKCKGPNCSECKFDLVCEGPWKGYPEKFGWSEFKPVKGKKVLSPSDLLGEK